MKRWKQRDLEILLSKVAPHPRPKLRLEEYTLDPKSAAKIAYIAGCIHDDIRGKRVADLGCGTGILAISAALLGAEVVAGVDIDREAVAVARSNCERLGVKVELIVGDIGCLRGPFDTVVMNPPFGTWVHGADVRFLEKSLEIARVVYSLHKRTDLSRDFLKRKIEDLGGEITHLYEIDLAIPPIHPFHRKRRYLVEADLYRIVRRERA